MCSRKKRIYITIVMIMILILSGTTGCGKNTEDAEQTGSFGVEAEELPAPETGNDDEEPEEAKTGGTDELFSEQRSNESGPASAAGDGRTFHYINEDKELYGDICEIGDMQFTVTEIYTEADGNGGETMVSLAPGAEEESPKITVVYDENTKFIKQKIWDGGANHEEREGSAEDLKKGLTAEMNGGYEGDVFRATEILIVEVIL